MLGGFNLDKLKGLASFQGIWLKCWRREFIKHAVAVQKAFANFSAYCPAV